MISDAAVEAGAAALDVLWEKQSRVSLEQQARAVLEAASIEIDCPEAYIGFVGECFCGGTGKLRVLLPDESQRKET